MQPEAISVKAIAAIRASDFMIFPDGKPNRAFLDAW
jgi:hypothetical protein